MQKKIIFISGVHGSGKGTLAKELNVNLGLKTYSASSLIKENSDYIENSKQVDDPERNQNALLKGLKSIDEKKIVVDGHFCLFDLNNEVINISFDVFDAINPIFIVNVYCPVDEIYDRILKRDGVKINKKQMDRLQKNENQRAISFCNKNSLELYQFHSGTPTDSLVKQLESL